MAAYAAKELAFNQIHQRKEKIGQQKSDKKRYQGADNGGINLLIDSNVVGNFVNAVTNHKNDDNIDRNGGIFFIPFDFHKSSFIYGSYADE